MSGKIYAGKANVAILNGDEDVRQWDDEELRRGQRRNKNGGWSGRPPKIVPKAVHDELVRRQYDAAARILRESLVDAVTLFAEIVRDVDADPAVRLKAGQLIVERVMGREPLRVNVEVKAKWEQAIEASIVSLPAGLVDAIEVEVWDGEDDRAGQYEDD